MWLAWPLIRGKPLSFQAHDKGQQGRDPGAPEERQILGHLLRVHGAIVPMAVRIKLKRFGRRHQPHFRFTAVDRRRSRNSRVIEELGSYNPISRKEDQQVSINRERIEYWLSVGAQPTDTVRRILEKQGLMSAPARPAKAVGAASGKKR